MISTNYSKLAQWLRRVSALANELKLVVSWTDKVEKPQVTFSTFRHSSGEHRISMEVKHPVKTLTGKSRQGELTGLSGDDQELFDAITDHHVEAFTKCIVEHALAKVGKAQRRIRQLDEYQEDE